MALNFPRWRPRYGRLAALLLVFLGGCENNPARRPTVAEAVPPPPRVTFDLGDVVEIKFLYTPELDEIQTVRPDGRISLHLVGDVSVRGKTPSELQKELLASYQPHLKSPEIVVIARTYLNNRVFVGGQVKVPGVIELPGTLTVLEAIMRSGGFDLATAEVENVVVIRHTDTARYGYSLNLKPTLQGEETPSFYLAPQDIVYVPRTKIVEVAQWIDQYFNQLIPQTGFQYNRRMGDSTVGIDTSAR